MKADRNPPDNRMVRCVLDGYTECASESPEVCICYEYQKIPDDKFGNLYERKLFAFLSRAIESYKAVPP